MTNTADPLAKYNAKRDFAKTKEPAGKRESSESGNIFMVQKHDATRLHWDLRLEADGVLKSWAVTKGPSPDPDIKRLAVRTEDHPMSYATFEGTIPEDEYGGGTVMLWDRGTWEPVEGKSWKDIDKGHLHFTLHGERMKGEWLLIRLKPREGEKRENWLLRKLQDEFAGEGDTLVQRELTSVSTGRSMAQIAGDEEGEFSLEGKEGREFAKQMEKAHKRTKTVGKGKAKGPKASGKPPAFRKPQLATLVDTVPAGNGWMHEIKFDGYRAMIACAGETVKVYTRSGKDWTDKFAPLVDAIAGLDLPPCLIDGEITAPGSDGNPDFSTLQSVLKRGHGEQGEGDALEFHAFDLLEANGEKLDKLTNIERKERLEGLLRGAGPPVYIADHVIGAGEKLYAAMCDAGQEGIISKKIDAPYRATRTKAWVKVKCTRRQEFVVIGYKVSKAKGRPFSSLLLAQNEGGDLVYKGNVGTGFTMDELQGLAAKLHRIERKTPPADVDKASSRGVTWVTPKLVAEIAFAEFTADGNVRHGSYLGLRSDKDAADVTPEKPAAAPSDTGPEVEISSRDRVVFPESGQTKGQLADYYETVAPIMLPFLARRPVSLVRCPQGRAKKCFFQKHDAGSFGQHVHAVPISEKDGGTEDYLYVEDGAGILGCVQMGTIEFHGWGSHVADVEKPDRMVFDLDPDEGLDFADVRRAARDIHDRLSDIGLVSFAMLSGGKGVHVVVPLTPGHDWDTHKDFSRRFAEALSLAEPDRFTANMSKAKRKGKIFIDYLRNQRGSTAVMPYSARAREGAPVAVPIAWGELKKMKDARLHSIDDAKRLLARAQSKGLAGWGFAEQTLPEV
ncbi:DNA ligase D [Aurantiacibacter spongiae]|uniref:DNA ligase (ATP) n=1 Tax=Aurantiacibacter spongiae TaxID=2488860 RepID=A0A3N5CPR1_9SPHN|nr:DNA ligase D [Aurantiacibacter spongiae]RPF70984.1 DNA ligase D [Aurantiacibacter spongiae]